MVKNQKDDVPADFDDLLSSEAKTESGTPDAEPTDAEKLAAALADVAALKASLEAKDAALDEKLAAANKSPEDAAKEMRDAQSNGLRVANLPSQFIIEDDPDAVLIHIVEDGFTEFDNVWLRGQEILIGNVARESTKDRFGNTWIDDIETLLGNPSAQIAKWGKVFIARGSFIGRKNEVYSDEVAALDAKRGRAVPTVIG